MIGTQCRERDWWVCTESGCPCLFFVSNPCREFNLLHHKFFTFLETLTGQSWRWREQQDLLWGSFDFRMYQVHVLVRYRQEQRNHHFLKCSCIKEVLEKIPHLEEENNTAVASAGLEVSFSRSSQDIHQQRQKQTSGCSWVVREQQRADCWIQTSTKI